MANAKPVSMDPESASNKPEAPAKPAVKGPVKINDASEMYDNEGKRMKGSFKLGDKVITNN